MLLLKIKKVLLGSGGNAWGDNALVRYKAKG